MNDISIDNDDEPIDTSQVVSCVHCTRTRCVFHLSKVVSINKEQYGCLVKLLSSPQYSYQPHYWTMTQPLVSWDELLTDEGQRIIWPICYRWLGPLRIGFLKEGVDCEELYEFLHDYYQTYSKSDNHPLSFLTFVHLGEGKFRLSIHQSLAKRDGIIKDTKAGNFKLRIDCTVGSSSVVTSSRRPSFNHKKAIFERFEEEIGSKGILYYCDVFILIIARRAIGKGIIFSE